MALQDSRRGGRDAAADRLAPNPINSRAFKARLADLSFLDQALFIYAGEGGPFADKRREALRIATAIVLSWIEAARKNEVNAETWTDRVTARRATFVAFIARAAACEGMIGNGEAAELLASIH